MKVKTEFSVFELAQTYWDRALGEGGWAIDATCGNGYDTLFLARKCLSLKGGVIGLDIQEKALLSTETLLKSNGVDLEKVLFFHQSHEAFPAFPDNIPIQLIVYNLGYLPGGNKALTTRVESTLKSVQNAMNLLSEGGLISLTCYPGHPEGDREQEALLAFTATLTPTHWCVTFHRWHNRRQAPSLLLLHKLNLKI